jgi:hypothetical protein
LRQGIFAGVGVGVGVGVVQLDLPQLLGQSGSKCLLFLFILFLSLITVATQ